MSGEILAAAPARTLADQLRGWSDDQLSRLLAARPDLATPAPADSAQLASRAATPASIHRALDRLSAGELLLLDAIAISGETTLPDLLPRVHADPDWVRTAVQRLVDMVLVWHAPEGLRALSGVVDAIGGHGSGLRALPADPLPDARIESALRELSEAARAMLEHVDAHGGEGRSANVRRAVTPAEARNPAEELLARGLLVPQDRDAFRIPEEVRLVLRGGRTTRDRIDILPELATSSRSPELIARTAAGAAFDAVRRVELLLDHWGLEPPGALRSGGLGVRDLKAAADLLHVEVAQAALLIEVAHAADLLAIGQDADGDPGWMPTDAFDAWSTRPAAERWARLAAAWLRTHRTPGRVGTRDQGGKAINALVPELTSPLAAPTRRAALAVLAELPEGTTLAAGTGGASLLARLVALRPRRAGVRTELVAATLTEAAVLGVTGLDGLSPHGRALVQDDEAATVAALAPLLPTPVEHVLVQADLTAVAPGPLESGLARKLQLVADVESRGGATVYRFSQPSIRRALDVGWTGPELHEFLDSISRTPIPQPLSYLIDDTVRTFGTIRVGMAEAFLTGDDEAALNALLHHPKAGTLGLRRIAPTVLISLTPLDVLLPRLRELGAAPVVEAPDGTVRVARPDLLRARTPRSRGSAGLVAAKESAHISSVISALRTGDRVAASRPARATTSPMDAMTALREGIEAGQTLIIGYVDNHGTSTERVVDPRGLEGGRLSAFDHRSEDVREFAVHRITSVRPVDR